MTSREVSESNADTVRVMKTGNDTMLTVYVGHMLKYQGWWYIVNEHRILGGPYDDASHASVWAQELRRMTAE